LKKFPFDTLKIDQSFIKGIHRDKDDLTITKMIIQISKVLNKKVVAEGVENETILNILEELGCDYAQGYYFAKPLDENELKEFILNLRI
jgi:EAL domain-containing protein (putative c-di-GMP-specific phosphodiesterase class I)